MNSTELYKLFLNVAFRNLDETVYQVEEYYELY